MKRIKNFKWGILVLVLHALIAAYFFANLPDDARIPVHWNIHNQIDGWAGKTSGTWLPVAFNVLLFLLLYAMPFYSPWYRRNQTRFDKVVPVVALVMALFLALISAYGLWVAKMGEIPGMIFILVLIGMLFIFLGNILPKVPKNFFIGIRTPWTLASETVWERTHRLGGWCFVLAGALMVLKGLVLIGHNTFQTVTAILALALLLWPMLYSLIVYRKLKNKQPLS
jgi:uncharacterized membrane protein